MNFKLNLMLIPFTVPRTAFNYLPSCDSIFHFDSLRAYVQTTEKQVSVNTPFSDESVP